MRKATAITAALATLCACGAVLAQDSPTQVSRPQTEEKGVVALGAGSTSAVTTGSSGSTSAPADTLPPIPVDMPYPPQPEGALALPGMLPITPPQQKRCDLVQHEAARQFCLRGSNSNPGPAR